MVISDEHAKRGFSDVVSYSVDWQGSVYIPPASGGVSYSASAIPSVSYYNSYSQPYGPSYSQPYGPSYSAAPSPGSSRGPNNNNNGPQNSQSIGLAQASSSTNPPPSSPGAASTFSNLGCSVTIALAALTGIVAFAL